MPFHLSDAGSAALIILLVYVICSPFSCFVSVRKQLVKLKLTLCLGVSKSSLTRQF